MTATAERARITGPVPAVRMSGVARRFGAIVANRDASIEVFPGEIHALVGENGAGKSTLMRILSGALAPDAGRVEVDGRDVTGWSATQAIAGGVGMVHQHFMLVPTLTVAENLVLGDGAGGMRPYRRAHVARAVAQLAETSGLAVDPSHLVADLSVGEAQRVEILRALYRASRILLLDEPTAALTPHDVAGLWSVLRKLRDAGTTIVLITHKLDEVMRISDRVTVMRHGTTVAHMATRDATPAGLARAMVGHDAGDVRAHVGAEASVRATGDREGHAQPGIDVRSLSVSGARVERAVDGVSFSVAAGEILGVAGVDGNGQAELVEAIAGLRPVAAGTIAIGGRDVTHAPVGRRFDAGLAHIPADRLTHGLILDFSVADNLILGRQRRFARGVTLDRAAVAEHAARLVAEFGIRPADPALPVRALSGGTQQKVVAARELSGDFAALLAAQPTRGMDIVATARTHDALRRARAAGRAILLVSTDLAEILALSDRIAVMYRGRFVAELSRADATEDLVGRHMTGAPGAGAW